MKGAVAALVLLLVPALVFASDRAIGEKVAAATEAFSRAGETEGIEARRAEYARAAELHERALTDHRNGALEYNTANAWFLAGDLGRAIVHYRRALELRPGDPQVLANLETSRSRRRDQIEAEAHRAIAETVFFWHRGLSLSAKVNGGLAAWLVGFALLTVLFTWDRRRRILVRLALAWLLVAVGLGVSGWVEHVEMSARDAAVVLADEVDLRKGDGASYPVRYENPIHSGTEVRVIEARGTWTHVELPDGKSGWLPSTTVERI